MLSKLLWTDTLWLKPFFQVFHICAIGKQHLEDREWNGVKSENTLVNFLVFQLVLVRN